MNSFSSLCKHWRLIRLWNTNIFTKDRKHYLKTFTYTSCKFSQVNFFIKTTKQIRSKHFTHSSLNILRIKPRSLKRTPSCHYSHLLDVWLNDLTVTFTCFLWSVSTLTTNLFILFTLSGWHHIGLHHIMSAVLRLDDDVKTSWKWPSTDKVAVYIYFSQKGDINESVITQPDTVTLQQTKILLHSTKGF